VRVLQTTKYYGQKEVVMAPNRRPPLIFPIILIVVGAIFLYANYRPAFDPWLILRTYWPLILIFIGLGKIWDSTQRQRLQQANNPNAPATPVYSVGSTIVILGVVLVLLALFWHGRAFSRDRRTDSFMHHDARTVDRGGAKSVNISVESGAGEVTVGSGAGHLLDADFSYGNSYFRPQVDYKVDSGVGQLTITQDGERTQFGTAHNDWNLRLSQDVPLTLKVEMGAGEGRFHLRDLQVTDLNVQMGAGHVDVDLTGDRKKDLNADLQGGVGQATIHLPKNVGVIANASGGIGAVSAHGFKHDGDDYLNDAYGKTAATIHLRVQGGVGQVTLLLEP
jgi:N-terminal domain of toast_rack, DUF2154/Domain of unknown function (DUF5668)